MLFNSIAFAVFLPLVFAGYWLLARGRLRVQNAFLILASYVFYGWWDYRFLSLIVLSSAVDYLVGLGLAGDRSVRRRRALLAVSLSLNLGLLGFFKYFNFFVESFARLLESVGLHPSVPTLSFILPVGISFYTFQTLSYTIDVYRGKTRPTRDVLAFFAFVSFFPQLVAGPIERASRLLPQFLSPRSFDPEKARDGMRQILWGLFKKAVIADNIAGHVESIFRDYASLPGPVLVVGVFLFAVQVYCDFSGYSDIAIGTARLFGFGLMRNFAFPYFSRSIAELWRRWHISLSTWFRDYVYIPLGGSLRGKARQCLNVFLTFTVSGFWHGADWTFVLWGMFNGLLYLPYVIRGTRGKDEGERPALRLFPSLRESGGMALTFTLWCIGLVIFRSASVPDAAGYFTRLTTGFGNSGLLAARVYLYPVVSCLVMFVVEWVQRGKQHALDIRGLPLILRWIVYLAVGNAIVFFASYETVEFFYFQF